MNIMEFGQEIMSEYCYFGASLVAQMVKNPPAMWEAQVQSLGREDPLKKEMATHFSTLAWKIQWMEEPGRLHTVHGVAKNQTQLSEIGRAHV